MIEAANELVREAADEKGISYSLFFQMNTTHDRGSLLHDDRLDALATAIQWLRNRLRRIRRSRCVRGLLSYRTRSLRTRTATHS